MTTKRNKYSNVHSLLLDASRKIMKYYNNILHENSRSPFSEISKEKKKKKKRYRIHRIKIDKPSILHRYSINKIIRLSSNEILGNYIIIIIPTIRSIEENSNLVGYISCVARGNHFLVGGTANVKSG